jgi:hypothetical protein
MSRGTGYSCLAIKLFILHASCETLVLLLCIYFLGDPSRNSDSVDVIISMQNGLRTPSENDGIVRSALDPDKCSSIVIPTTVTYVNLP